MSAPPRHTAVTPLAAVAVVVPAKDEEERISCCLRAVLRSLDHPCVRGLQRHVVLALDDSGDATADIASSLLTTPGREPRGEVLHLAAGSAAAARHAGVEAVLKRFAALDPATVWVATTDADTVVPADWLTVQVRLADEGADAVAGTIEVDDWSEHPESVREHYLRLLRSRLLPEGRHTHAYGANLGVRASAYVAVSGFPDMVGEDKALRDRLRDAGFDVRQPSGLVVRTSGRRIGRAGGGLADLLGSLGRSAPR